jgi:hypothetical protein
MTRRLAVGKRECLTMISLLFQYVGGFNGISVVARGIDTTTRIFTGDKTCFVLSDGSPLKEWG